MPRMPRLLLTHSYYHIMARGNNRHQIFNTDNDFRYYLELIAKFKQEHPFNLYHYCLMPNHIHYLIQTRSVANFSTFMKRLNLSYYHYFKSNYGWVGYFWQGRYKSQPVGKDSYFIQAGKYIELNPVRAELVKYPQDYQWSSYKYYILGKKDDLITEDIFYPTLGITNSKRQRAYSLLMIDDIITESYAKKIWGSPSQRYNEQQKQKRKLNTPKV